mmetsp:Transcript_11138/g.31575  ORF Transcript_11138/g.31575 Transcript_11138/m.31575 type:complete len:239 (-) Transcript_11138:322-1038(-)
MRQRPATHEAGRPSSLGLNVPANQSHGPGSSEGTLDLDVLSGKVGRRRSKAMAAKSVFDSSVPDLAAKQESALSRGSSVGTDLTPISEIKIPAIPGEQPTRTLSNSSLHPHASPGMGGTPPGTVEDTGSSHRVSTEPSRPASKSALKAPSDSPPGTSAGNPARRMWWSYSTIDQEQVKDLDQDLEADVLPEGDIIPTPSAEPGALRARSRQSSSLTSSSDPVTTLDLTGDIISEPPPE